MTERDESSGAWPDQGLIRGWLAEDVGGGDSTAAIIPAESIATATVVTREPMVLCGRDWFNEVFLQLDPSVAISWLFADAENIPAGARLCKVEGRARALLTGERTALNLLQTLSGTATTAAAYAQAMQGTGTKVLDTRKTIPGLRLAQKYAVRCGGCHNHRIGLFDAILIKENHILAAGSIAAAVASARRLSPELPLEVEVESLDELRQALEAGAPRILLDDFSLEHMRLAVELTAGRAQLEVSGGVGLESLRAIAETGVDFISVGALTKHVRAIDLSMRVQLTP